MTADETNRLIDCVTYEDCTLRLKDSIYWCLGLTYNPEDVARIELPDWRYDQITEAVIAMYDKVDAHIMPLPVFDIANGLGYSVIPYRAYGQLLHEILLSTSQGTLS